MLFRVVFTKCRALIEIVARADRLIGLAVLLFGLAHSLAARADSPLLPPPPLVPVTDANRFNVLTQAIDIEGPRVSVGPVGQGGLSYNYFGNSQTGQPWVSSIKRTGSGGSYLWTVALMGGSEAFTPSGGTFTPTYPKGGSLTQSGSNYIYVKADGTTATFNGVSYCDPLNTICMYGLINTITYASGEVLTFTTRTAGLFVGIQSINSNLDTRSRSIINALRRQLTPATNRSLKFLLSITELIIATQRRTVAPALRNPGPLSRSVIRQETPQWPTRSATPQALSPRAIALA